MRTEGIPSLAWIGRQISEGHIIVILQQGIFRVSALEIKATAKKLAADWSMQPQMFCRQGRAVSQTLPNEFWTRGITGSLGSWPGTAEALRRM